MYVALIDHHFWRFGKNYQKHFLFIDTDTRLAKFIGDLKELSAKLLITKMTGYLSKNYRFRTKLPPSAGGKMTVSAPYLIFVIFFTQPQFEAWKFYT